eukprot:jgi/Galph1/4222/GphlegSOOS_G2910.1
MVPYCVEVTTNRRDFLKTVTLVSASAAGASLSLRFPSLASESIPSELANQVQSYKDLVNGYKILRPTGWNEFGGQPDQYDIKWQDLIQPLEAVTIATKDIGKTKSVKDLGSVQQVGEKLANIRKMNLVSAVEKEKDGIPFYEFELKAEPLHELVLLTIAKRKLFDVSASCSESRWFKRERLLRGVVDSFVPSL